MQAIVFDIFGFLNSIQKSGMTLFLAIFVLEDTQIHVSISDSDNIATNIKTFIDEAFCFTSTLNIPNINPNDRHI